MFLSSSFTCLKEEARKGHPSFPSRFQRDTLRFSLLSGRKKTRLRLKQFSRLILTTTVMLSVKGWGLKDKHGNYCHFTQPSSVLKIRKATRTSTPKNGA